MWLNLRYRRFFRFFSLCFIHSRFAFFLSLRFWSWSCLMVFWCALFVVTQHHCVRYMCSLSMCFQGFKLNDWWNKALSLCENNVLHSVWDITRTHTHTYRESAVSSPLTLMLQQVSEVIALVHEVNVFALLAIQLVNRASVAFLNQQQLLEHPSIRLFVLLLQTVQLYITEFIFIFIFLKSSFNCTPMLPLIFT